MRGPQECPETNGSLYERGETIRDRTQQMEMQMMCKKEGLEGEEKREKSAPLVVPPKKKKRERESGTEDTSSAPLLPGFMTYKTAILSRCARGFHTVSIARALFRTHTHATRDAHDGRCCSLFFKRMEEETKNSRTHPSTTHIQ